MIWSDRRVFVVGIDLVDLQKLMQFRFGIFDCPIAMDACVHI